MDEELVAKAKDGDLGAFRTLAIEQHPRLFGAAYGCTGSSPGSAGGRRWGTPAHRPRARPTTQGFGDERP
jgi:hypothetical protein